MEMTDIDTLRVFVNERLNAVAEDIIAVFVRTILGYQQHIDMILQRSQQSTQTQVTSHQLSDILAVEICAEQQERSSRLVQEEPKPPQIKEEQQESLQRPEEAGGSALTLPSVKSEDDEITQREPLSSSSSEPVETQEEVYGASQQLVSPPHWSGSDTEDRFEWELTNEALSALNALKSHNAHHLEPGEILDSATYGIQRHRLSLSNALSQDPTPSRQTMRSGEKPFSCTVCARTFKQSAHLKVHLRTHTGEKPYSCTFCGKTFSQSGSLKMHMRIHTGEKPFGCMVCGKSFNQSGSLTLHMRVHTGEKPYSCTLCGKCFSIKQVLKKHMEIHTEENPVN